jgi:hypothetical protein
MVVGPVPAGAVFTITRRRGKNNTMATLQLEDNQECPLSIQADDAAGNPTTLPAGSVAWASSNTAVATVTPSADGSTAVVAAAGQLGTAQVSVQASVASGPISGTLDVTVVAGAAATIQIVTGTPTTIPTATPAKS